MPALKSTYGLGNLLLLLSISVKGNEASFENREDDMNTFSPFGKLGEKSTRPLPLRVTTCGSRLDVIKAALSICRCVKNYFDCIY
jgi:hypothetical protein